MRAFKLEVKKSRGVNLHLGKHKKDLRLSWKQAKRKYPQMKKYSDSDFDGTPNIRDCKPLNPGQDKVVTRAKAIAKGVREQMAKALRKKAATIAATRKKELRKPMQVIGRRLAGVPRLRKKKKRRKKRLKRRYR